MATGSQINDWIENMANVADMNADTLKIALSNTAPASETSDPRSDNNGVLANVTEISYTNYSDDMTVDRTLESITSTQTSGTWTLDAANIVITASGGALATFRYIYFYDDTPTSPADPLIAVFDHGSAITLASAQTATITVNATGIMTI